MKLSLISLGLVVLATNALSQESASPTKLGETNEVPTGVIIAQAQPIQEPAQAEDKKLNKRSYGWGPWGWPGYSHGWPWPGWSHGWGHGGWSGHGGYGGHGGHGGHGGYGGHGGHGGYGGHGGGWHGGWYGGHGWPWWYGGHGGGWHGKW
ncbi:cold and drought-regulated protein CORA-like [Diprion similis]|uniref:cold and drought-regulated protein CORA-like n=1 Tax=Diprion similis TaxID=362088 RepID=UPI001EF7FDBF|nr:cold and drought-regulated protein CORA-like [Diprion similis]